MAPEPPRILVVDPDPARTAALVEALRPDAVATARDGRSALEVLLQGQVLVVVVDSTLPDMAGLDLLRQCRQAQPECIRILLADYSEVPDIIRARADHVVTHVAPRATDAPGLPRLVRQALGTALEPSVTRAPPGASGDPSRQGFELLRWSVEQLARLHGVVVRGLPPDRRALQLQFVLPASELGTLRARLAKGWPGPVDTSSWRARLRPHPVARLLGGLAATNVLYAWQGEGGAFAFVALLPWTREPRVTAVLGFLAPTRPEALRPQLEDLHAFALRRVREFPIPRLPSDDEATGAGQPVLEYDWVVTDTYAGPDRRWRETTFINRFVFFGRRKRVASRLLRVSNPFVDQLPSGLVRYAAAYLLLSTLDTYFTWRFVGDGTVREMNPILRPLLRDFPAVFFLAKNLFALSGLFALTRFHLFKTGRAMLRASLALYLALDAYWLWLLATVWRR